MISEKKLEDFLADNRITEEKWRASGLTWEELVSIGVDHEKQLSHLEATAALMASVVQRFTSVHSVRWRVKDVEHLLSKIVRKRAGGSQKYAAISAENYSEIVTDLIGMRALHLFKSDFANIHVQISEAFNLVETAVVYVREGDSPEFRSLYADAGFRVENHPHGYRSIHYVAITQPLKRNVHVEIQVRTIFEEGWSEIDHTIRYPNFSDDVQVIYLLAIFNRMAGSADEIGGFIKTLARVLADSRMQLDVAIKEKDESVAKMEAALEQLAAAKNDQNASDQIIVVQEELKKLKTSSQATTEAGPRGIKRATVLVGRGADSETLRTLSKALEDPSGIKAAIQAMEDPGGVKAMMKAIEDPGGVKAMMKAMEDPGGVKAMMKAMEDPSGVKAMMKAMEDPGGIKGGDD